MTEKTLETPSAPLIGQFPEAGKENKPRLPRKEKAEEAPPEQQEAAKEERNDDGNRPPTYEEQLKKVGLNKAEARLIMEKILTQGYYEEEVAIGTIPVVLRTRNYEDTLRAQRFLEVENPSYPVAINEVLARYNIAASLVRVGDKQFKIEATDVEGIEEEFNERYRFLVSRPTVVVSKLMTLVHKFDTKMAVVFADEAPEDF